MSVCFDSLSGVSRRRFLLSLVGGLAAGCGGSAVVEELLTEAAEFSREAVTVDLHCHPNSLSGGYFPRLDPDVPGNMHAGGLDAGVFAVRGDYPVIRRDPSGRRYESRTPRAGELFRNTQQQLDEMKTAVAAGKIALARTPAEILESKKIGSPCALLAIEGSDPLEGDLARVQLFYDRGVRVLQLLHYRINEIGDIQTESPRHKGLTAFGRDVVKEMNRLGMIIDVAHCSSETVRGVLSVSRHPVICSHTGPYALRHIARHLEDKVLREIADKGGLIGVWPLLRRRENFETWLREVGYVRDVAGIDHVGVGTDLFV
jgi:membrane dipeptidase